MKSSVPFNKLILNFMPALVSSGFLFIDCSHLFFNRIIQATTRVNFVQLPIHSNESNILDLIAATFTFVDFTSVSSSCILQSVSYLFHFDSSVHRKSGV